MSLYVEPKLSILTAANTQNGLALKMTDVTFSTVAVASEDVQTTSGKNSTVQLVGNGTTWNGTVAVNYNRLPLSDLLTLVGSTLKVHQAATTLDLLRQLNYQYGMVLTADDIVDEPVILDGEGKGNVVLKAKVTSYGWIGSVALNIVHGDEVITYAVQDTSLDGLRYPAHPPTGQNLRPQAPIALYRYDFTSNKALIESITDTDLGVVTAGTPAVQLAAAIQAKEVAAGYTPSPGWEMRTNGAARNLYQSKIVYRGLVTPELKANQLYKYVCMIQLCDGSAQNGTTASNNTTTTGFYGILYLHYNDPIE